MINCQFDAGRPFVLELVNPHKVSLTSEESKDLQKRVNDSTKDVQIRDLQKVTRYKNHTDFQFKPNVNY